jgi:hypothetical protein
MGGVQQRAEDIFFSARGKVEKLGMFFKLKTLVIETLNMTSFSTFLPPKYLNTSHKYLKTSHSKSRKS